MPTLYLDFEAHSGHLSGTVTFTNGSATVTGSGTAFTTELANNDYIRQSDGTQWYKVTARGSNTSLTITPTFQQATHTDDADASMISASTTQDGTTTTKAFCHFNRYTTDTTRTAGDILKVRANQTHIYAGVNIIFDEDGTVVAPIQIVGCSVADDPWSDSSDVKPIVDFNDTAFYFNPSTDDFWVIKRIDTRQSANTANWAMANCKGWVFDDCVFREASGGTAYGVYVGDNDVLITFRNCQFLNNKNYHIYMPSGKLILDNCVFNGGAEGTQYAIRANNSTELYISNTTFGVTTTHSQSTFYTNTNQRIYSRNSYYADSTIYSLNFTGGVFYSEDHQQVKGASFSAKVYGVVERSSAVQLDSLDSVKMTPVSVTPNYGLTISQGGFYDYALWLPASATTITIKARETAAWSADPTAAEFYFEATYLNHATAATRTVVTSAQALSGTSEISFTMTFTPSAEGWVYVTCYLKKYEAGKSVNVSVKPVVT